MTTLFDAQLLNEFVEKFYGYGNYNGQLWFVGMEEGGGNSFSEIENRLNAWTHRGKNELEDLAQYHAEIGMTDWFNDKPKLQSSWNKLIRILLSSKGQSPTTEEVREYQKILLGKSSGDNCLVNLLPLPSPSIERWLYAEHSQLHYLSDRLKYKKWCLKSRIEHLRNRINQYKPKVVVFYSLGYYKYWQEIIGIDLLQEADNIHTGYNETTFFVITKHPATKGVTNEYFHQVGKLIEVSNKRQS